MNADMPWTAVDRYFETRLVRPDAPLDAALASSRAEGLPAISVTPAFGKLLQLLAQTVDARRILEVGTLGGYSAIWLARALPAGGRLVTLEVDPKHARVAAANLARAGLEDRVDLRIGAALDTLPRIEREAGPAFDLVFIDADKQNNAAYFDWALRLSRPGGVIVVDNVVRRGAVADADSRDGAVLGVRRLVERLEHEPRVSATVLQTVGEKGYDGFLLARVLA